jgi:hypothetical protein
MSASAFTATEAGSPGDAGIVDQTVEPKLTTGFCGLSGEAISMAALPAGGSWAGFCVCGAEAVGSVWTPLRLAGRGNGSGWLGRVDRRGLGALGDLCGALGRLLLSLGRRGDREVLRLLTHEDRRRGYGQDDAEHGG